MYVFGRPPLFETKARKNRNNCNKPSGLGWIAFAYFISFCVLGAMILLTLFVGVVATAMEEAKAEYAKAASTLSRCARRAEALELEESAIESYRHIFALLDTRGEGKLSHESVKYILHCQGYIEVRMPEFCICSL